MPDDQLLYAVRDGRQIGRFARDKLDALLASGQLERNDFPMATRMGSVDFCGDVP